VREEHLKAGGMSVNAPVLHLSQSRGSIKGGVMTLKMERGTGLILFCVLSVYYCVPAVVREGLLAFSLVLYLFILLSLKCSPVPASFI